MIVEMKEAGAAAGWGEKSLIASDRGSELRVEGEKEKKMWEEKYLVERMMSK